MFSRAATKIFVLMACVVFLPVTQAADAPKVVRGGWYPWDPYQYRVVTNDTTQLTGLDTQLLRAAFQRMGYEVTSDEVSWGQHQQDIKEGRRDIAAGAFKNPERAEYAYYSAPYRIESDVLFVRTSDAGRWHFENADELLQQWRMQPFRLGVVEGFYYGPTLAAYMNDPANTSNIISVGNEVANFENLLAGKIDGFVADRLVGATLAWRNDWQAQVTEVLPPVFEGDIHVIFSKKTTTPELVAAFNKSMSALRQSGQYNLVVHAYLLPVLLGMTVGREWFFIVDIIGTIAFALSGVLLARQGKYSLFGAFVLSALPAVGGGIIRDVIVDRDIPSVLGTPAYLLTVLITVLVCFVLFRLKSRSQEKHAVADMANLDEQMLFGGISINKAVAFFDALGLATFTVIGVVVAVETDCQPLWLWGPLLGAFTGAGGGILRDVIRADADNPGLKGSFYAEVALIWGLIFSLFLMWFANTLEYDLAHLTLAVAVVIIGGVATRMAVFNLKLKSPMF